MRRFAVGGVAALVAAGFVAFAQAEPGTQSVLTAYSGQGTGHVLISPTAKDKPNFAVQVEVNVHGMLPSSTFTVERKIDQPADGACPGSTVPTDWVPNGPITTSKGGAGAEHFFVERVAPFVSGYRFDVVFHVIGPGTELRSNCMTVTVK